jgi:hypothetical protein
MTRRFTQKLNHEIRRIFCSRGTNDLVCYFFIQEVYLLVSIGDHLCAIGGLKKVLLLSFVEQIRIELSMGDNEGA